MDVSSSGRLRAGFFLVTFLTSAVALALSYGPIEHNLVTPTEPIEPGDTFVIHLDISAGEGVHVYRDKTRIEWSRTQGARLEGEPVRPESRTIMDPADPLREVAVYEGDFRITYRFKATEQAAEGVELKGTLHFQGCTDQVCYAPAKIPVEFSTSDTSAAAEPVPSSPVSSGDVTPLRTEEETAVSAGEFFWNLLWAFGVGFLISLTPCVLPMIPVTSAVITSLGKSKGWSTSLVLTLVYVLGLALVYAVAGAAAALLGSQVQAFLSQWYVRVPIAAVFVLLALSMFDVITIQVPQFIQNKLSGARGRSPEDAKDRPIALALGPAFGMGLIAGLVAGPCVAAPLAALLVHVATVGNYLYGFWMLFAVALGMAPLLIVAGTMPGLIPKRGMWMVTLKKLFGFVLLWAALYFTRSLIGDAAYYLGSAALTVFAAVFLGCLDRLTPESGAGARFLHAVGILAVLAAAGMAVFGVAAGMDLLPKAPFRPATAEEVEQAVQSGSPVVIDFWAEYCSICKKLESGMFQDPQVRNALQGVEALKVDVEAFPEVAEKYGLIGVPHLTFIDASGKERTDIPNGAPSSAEELVQRIEKLKSGEPWTADADRTETQNQEP